MKKESLSLSSPAIITSPVYMILVMMSLSHLLNDTIQSLIPAIYPLVKNTFRLNFAQVGLITLTFQLAASLLQPVVGLFTDRRPQPFSLVTGMGITLTGLLLMSRAWSFEVLLVSVALIGIGSSIFHPEASKVAYMASGGKRGLAQSIFQVGGNAGSALGPLLAALIIVPYGQSSISWFSLLALVAMVVLFLIGRWYAAHNPAARQSRAAGTAGSSLSRGKVILSVTILLVLIFSKYFYLASMTSYYTFYLIAKFHVTVQQSQYYLFLFLGAVAAGTLLGGPLGDRFGRKYVIWFSILGVAPFSLFLPYASLFWTAVLSVPIGVILASAFPAILVYAQELLPGKICMISGLFYGFAFGMGGLGSALLGTLADHSSLYFVYHLCAYLPLIGLITGLLPDLSERKASLS